MKQTISALVLVAFLFCSTASYALEAHCLNSAGKYSDCSVNIESGIVDINFDKKKETDKKISGNDIIELTKGEYARRRVGESVGLAFVNPAFLFMLFSKKKRDIYGIIYDNGSGGRDAVMVEIKQKYSAALATQLMAVSGKDIQDSSPPPDSKKD